MKFKSIDSIIDYYSGSLEPGDTGPCQGFEGLCDEQGITYRQNTKYVDDKMNIVTMCPKCKKGNDEYWNDMWADFYGGMF